MTAHRRSVPAGQAPALASRLARLVVGAVGIGAGIALLQRARFGMSPMDVLHLGIAQRFGFSLGGGIIAAQAVMLMAFLPLRIRPGVGTVVGFVIPAVVADLLLAVLPTVDPVLPRIGLLAAGGACFCAGVATYLAAELGPMPRDGLMLAFGKGRPRRIAAVRIGLDIAFLVVGTALLGPDAALHGGGIGPGTLVLALGCGPAIAWLLRRARRGPGRARRVPEQAQPGNVIPLPSQRFDVSPHRFDR
ncbi:hypothetical protein CU254_41515 (plasmid) [Amycolatopsis sp. AA4]|uniref:YczE/YyaS/YitT family protein n=1 Tax=Actinomycetes TaxID=1760 RepID=UPI0001B556B8|nr:MULTISPECIES: hypothetical protein [Actinomycetes]ATY17066.1 hypothetical protein CU254_41515 [Amycolatopsis sp. AA4]EFL12437.1 predicted protein [Streptomyces sp. AA4]